MDLHQRLPLTLLTLSYREAFPANAQNDDVLRTFTENSQTRLEALVASYLAGDRTYDTQWYAQHGPTHPDYSHLRHFAWLYAQQIALVERMLQAHPARRLTVLDLATGHGGLLLALGRHLVATHRAARVKLIGIDCSEHDMRFARAIATTALPEVDITWVQDDLTCPGFADRLRRYRADLVMANHILEHLPGGEIQNRYLQDWVLAAHLALSISVPLAEDLTCSPSQHVQQYTAEAVEQLAHSMEIRVGFAIEASDITHTHTGGLLTWVKTPDMLRGGGFEGTVLTLRPQGIAIQPHPLLEDFAKPFEPAEFRKKARTAPKIAEIQDKATFEQQGQQPRQVRQLPIKMPGTAVKLPRECAQFAEAVQLIIDHNQAANPEYERSYAYLNFFRGLTLFSSYRGLSLQNHGDQLQSLRTAYAFKPDWSYIVSNTLPTIFYDQPFDLTEALARFRAGEPVNLYDSMNSQADERYMYRSENFGIYLLSPYIVHSAAAAERDVYRVFMKVAFSTKRFYDNRELRRNPAFDTADWYQADTVGYLGGWLSHAHWNERFLQDDVCPGWSNGTGETRS